MRITVLDGNALNPGDLSWSPLERLGELTVYPRTEESKVIERMAGSEAVLLNKISITEEILTACPSLRYIGVQATGYNVIDVEACRRHNVTVTNVPSYSTAGVAQLTMAFILEAACRTHAHTQSVMSGDWTRAEDFCYQKAPLTELDGKTLGIFGYGSIGKRVEKIARALGMNTIVCTRTPSPQTEHPVDFETLLKESDIVSLHAPLTPQTSGIINAGTLSLMKGTAWLINTARGALVDEEALADALKCGRISFYACDVVREEPMSPSNPLLTVPQDRIIITPHIAWAAKETRQRLLDEVAENLRSFQNGKLRNAVT